MITVADAARRRDRSVIRLAGLAVSVQHPMTAKNFVFIALEDETGMINVTLRPTVYQAHRALLHRHPLLVIDGRLQVEGKVLNVIATRLRSVDEALDGPRRALRPGQAAAHVPLSGHGRLRPGGKSVQPEITQTQRGLRAPGPQSVTFVELFFDLVFVFAVTQVTVLTAHHLDPGGILRSLLLFWLIWWAWTQFTWTLNPADTTHAGVRLITLAATAFAFIMATRGASRFEEDAVWFAVPYVVVRDSRAGAAAAPRCGGSGRDPRGVGPGPVCRAIGLALVLAGAFADPSLRVALWPLTIVADIVAAEIAGRAQEWDLHAGHLSERHGLFVIIALGESLIVAGTAVAAEERTAALTGVAILAVVVACLLWWTYFGWLKEALEHGALARQPEPDRLRSPATRSA